MIENYNPDVLTCPANLSNDEVFTLPQIANQMLALLHQPSTVELNHRIHFPHAMRADRLPQRHDHLPN